MVHILGLILLLLSVILFCVIAYFGLNIVVDSEGAQWLAEILIFSSIETLLCMVIYIIDTRMVLG